MAAERPLAALRPLVAHATIAGEPNGALVADLAERLAAAGADVRVLDGARPDAANLHAVLGPADAEGGLLLAAHTDVVDVDGQPWSHDPFALRVADGRAYGRGAADMKGFIATVLAALEDADPARLRRPLHVALSSDEELGCRGVVPLLDTLAALPAPPARVLVGEPTELRVVDRHKGKAALRAHVRGRAAHSSLGPAGVNAVAYAARLVTGLLELQDELATGPTDDAFAVPHATIGIGPIAGGVAVNVVPDRCRLDLEVRTLPGQDADELLARVSALAGELEARMRAAAPEASIAFEPLSAYPALRPAGDSGALAAAVASLAGADGAPGAVDFGTEAGLYQQRLGVPVVVCGPGSMAQGHQADEFIALDQLERGERLVRALLDDLAVQRGTGR